jgi:2-polyprenyl-6-methoxyphenol hydroxylase-like FAD-dependent oxidoreductase
MVIGGGIGGLTTALCLHAAGLDVRVFESVGEIRELGVGINLPPHAVKELTDLGLLDALLAAGVQTQELRYFTKRGQEIWQEPRGLAAGYRWPQFSIHRGTLQRLLLDAALARIGPDNLRTGHHLAAFDQPGDGTVVARFVARRAGTPVATETGDVLIGADGIHSAVRRQLYPDEGPPVWDGTVLWRATTPGVPGLTGRSMIIAGHARQKFVYYPITPAPDARGRVLLNWAVQLHAAEHPLAQRGDWNRLGDVGAILPAFDGWRFPWLDIPALLRQTAVVYEYLMVDRDPLDRWSFGRVTLLGDAAHPMYPAGSNGAAQAILDARALADALAAARAGDGDIPAALGRYEAARRPPTTRLVLSNRQEGPERILQLVEERAPEGFDDLEAVVPRAELEAIAAQYKQAAGFDRQTLNQAAR